MAVPMATPAQAIFGLSTCEKVKKQVLAYEGQIDAISDYWRQYKGKTITPSLRTKFDIQSDPKNDVVLKLTKIQFNNPKCFTRTQNEEINARKAATWDFYYFVKFSMDAVLRSAKKCQADIQRILPSSDCLIRYDYKITETYSIPSIYNS
jgi:hypothetical protein